MLVLRGQSLSVEAEQTRTKLYRLGTYIDVLQIHRMDRDVSPEEIMKALNDVVESGKVRYLGASSVCPCSLVLVPVSVS